MEGSSLTNGCARCVKWGETVFRLDHPSNCTNLIGLYILLLSLLLFYFYFCPKTSYTAFCMRTVNTYVSVGDTRQAGTAECQGGLRLPNQAELVIQ